MKELLKKKVSRKEFLQYTGFAFLAVTGITSMLGNLGKVEEKFASKPKNNFGSGSYGG